MKVVHGTNKEHTDEAKSHFINMLVRKALQLKHSVKMENLAMKEDHPLATYSGTFVIALNAKKKKSMMMTMQEEGRKDSPNRS